MASSEEMRRLVLHAAELLAMCEPMENYRVIREYASSSTTRVRSQTRAVNEVAAIATAVTTLRLVAACMAVESDPWQEGYKAGAEMSHSLGCDAVQAERDMLREQLAAQPSEAPA